MLSALSLRAVARAGLDFKAFVDVQGEAPPGEEHVTENCAIKT